MKLPFDFRMDSIFYWMSIFSLQTLYWGRDCFFFLPFGLCQHGTWKTMPFIIIRFVRAPGHHSCLKNITKKRRGKHFVTIRSISFKKVGVEGRKRRKMTESWNDVGWLYLCKVQEIQLNGWNHACVKWIHILASFTI